MDPTSRILEDNQLKNFERDNWIGPTCIMINYAQASQVNWEKTCKEGFWVDELLHENWTQFSTICSSILTRNTTLSFWHSIITGDENGFYLSTRSEKDTDYLKMSGQCQHQN